MPYNILSLFTGIGGFELGILVAGLDNIFYPAHFVEMDSYCQSILSKHFPTVPITPLIQDLDTTKQYDIITAGFPCPPHSVAGKRLGSKDSRDLWPATLDVIKQVKPKAFILENVPGIRTTQQGNFFKQLLRDIASIGYDAQWSSVNVSSLGGVHQRKRFFLIATNTSSIRQSKQKGYTQKGTDSTPTSADITQLSPWLQVKSNFCRVDDGLSSRMDWLMQHKDKEENLQYAADNLDKPLRKQQLKALGNAIVPAQAVIVWKKLYQILTENGYL